MKLKKLLAVTAVCAVLTATLVIPASAHGGGHGGGHRYRSQTNYPACTVESCDLGYAHAHDGTTYCGNGTAASHNGCHH